MTTPQEPSIYSRGPYDQPPAKPAPRPPVAPIPSGTSVNWPIVIAAVCAAVVVLMAAAGGTVWFLMRPSDGTPVAAPATSAAADRGHAATTAPEPSAAPPVVHRVGETVTWEGGLKVTAYSFSTPVAKGAPKPDQSGYAWGAIDVQVCVPAEATINDQPWYLRYADNTTIEPSSIGYNQFPKPEYPSGDRTVTAGTCTRGWITYAVPANTRPVRIVYSTDDTEPAEWTI